MSLNDDKHLSSGVNHRLHLRPSYVFDSMIKTWKRATNKFTAFRISWIFIILLTSSILIDNNSFAQALPKAPPLAQSMINSRPPS